jgi:plasmid replication initiation protein
MEVKHVSSLTDRIARMGAEAAKRKNESVSPPEDTSPPKAEKSASVTPLRRKPKVDQRADFFLPVLYDIGARDSRRVMDVAPFRLSKKDLRPNTKIVYDLPDGHITVTSGPHGMASVWDYDIVLMAISHLTEAMNRFRDGKGEKPGPNFRPHIGAVLKFCRRENGGKQKDSIVGALERLASTLITIERKKKVDNKLLTITEGENHIAKFAVITNEFTGKVEFIEIKIADWIYRQVTEGKGPDVLTVHPDYFLIEQGVGRFVYRLARRAAGKTKAVWGFQTIYERSGSNGTFKEFCRILRKVIKTGNFPEYILKEENGQMGPLLAMIHKDLDEAEDQSCEEDLPG